MWAESFFAAVTEELSESHKQKIIVDDVVNFFFFFAFLIIHTIYRSNRSYLLLLSLASFPAFFSTTNIVSNNWFERCGRNFVFFSLAS